MYPYGYGYGDYAGVMLAALIGMLIAIFVIVVPLYILMAVGLSKMAKNKGIQNPWLAWVPIGNFYMLGKVVDNVDVASMNINKLEMVLPVAFIAIGILSNIPFLGGLISLAFYVFLVFVAIKIAKMYAPENFTMYAVLTALFFPIMIFVLRNKMAVDVPATGKPIFGATGAGPTAGPTDPGPTDPSGPTAPY